jgi:cytochrome c-type biogenesis protein
MVLSGVFVLGLAAAFTALGLVAAMTGSLLGDIGRGWKAVLGLILLVMGLHLLGLFALPSPSQGLMQRFHGAGLVGAFALGALTGTLSAPCATPALAAVLTIVALQKKILWGGVLLFAYALGHVLLLFMAGASSGWAMHKAISPKCLEGSCPRSWGCFCLGVASGFSGWLGKLDWGHEMVAVMNR